MGEPETSLIRLVRPKREWLLRCNDSNNRLSTCCIGVNNGDIDIYGPDEDDRISLEPAQVAEFHAALHEAIILAEDDLQTPRLKRTAAQGPEPRE